MQPKKVYECVLFTVIVDFIEGLLTFSCICWFDGIVREGEMFLIQIK